MLNANAYITLTDDIGKFASKMHRLPVSVEEFVSWSKGQGRERMPSRINEMLKFNWCDDEVITYIEFETHTPGEVGSLPKMLEVKGEDMKNIEFHLNCILAGKFTSSEMSNILYRTKQHLSTNSVVDIP